MARWASAAWRSTWKTPEGKDILWRLVRGADVFIEGFRPGTIQRYGFGYDEVSAKVPGVIYYSISGFGQTGAAAAARPAMDPVLQAFTGSSPRTRASMTATPTGSPSR